MASARILSSGHETRVEVAWLIHRVFLRESKREGILKLVRGAYNASGSERLEGLERGDGEWGSVGAPCDVIVMLVMQGGQEWHVKTGFRIICAMQAQLVLFHKSCCVAELWPSLQLTEGVEYIVEYTGGLATAVSTVGYRRCSAAMYRSKKPRMRRSSASASQVRGRCF